MDIACSALFSYIQNASTTRVIEGFKNMIPLKTNVIREGEKIEIDVTDLTNGDIVYIKSGEKIPADIRIIESNTLKVDNSSLTGESDPITKTFECTDENHYETRNLAFYSTSVVSGTGKGIVIRTGDNTIIGRIAKLASSAVYYYYNINTSNIFGFIISFNINISILS